VIIPAVFGDKWDDSVPVMQILCLFGLQFSVMQFNASLLQSIGRARLVFRLSLVGVVLQLVLFAVAVNFGIEAVAAALVVRGYLVAPIGLVVAARELRSSVWTLLAGLRAPAISSLVMAGAVFSARAALDGVLPDALVLSVLVAVAAGTYAAVLRVVGPAVFAEALTLLRSALGRAAPAGRQPELA
jgi:PST family polysaccharide transporter